MLDPSRCNAAQLRALSVHESQINHVYVRHFQADGYVNYMAFVPRAAGTIKSMTSFENAVMIASEEQAFMEEDFQNFFELPLQQMGRKIEGMHFVQYKDYMAFVEQCESLSASEKMALLEAAEVFATVGDPFCFIAPKGAGISDPCFRQHRFFVSKHVKIE